MKTIFIKSDKVGDGELGSMLMQGFLNAISDQKELPESIIFVNSAVLLTTADENEPIIAILKKLEALEIKMYSCGTCLDFYNKREDLKIGVPGNAKDTVETLLTKDIVTF
jgi:selenium metabolism protein YedF